MNVECCCICGWDKATCDFHHINGKKIPNADSEYNITLICPNCHRMIHEEKLNKDKLIPLSKIIGNRWKNYIVKKIINNELYFILNDK